MRIRSFRFCISLAAVLATVNAPPVLAEDTPPPPQDSTGMAVVPLTDMPPAEEPDTTIFIPSGDVSAAQRVDNPANFEEHLYQNPTVALFKSMLVPGLGQLGNRRYVKATLIAGLEVWLIGTAIQRDGEVNDARDRYQSMDDTSLRRLAYLEYDELRKSRNKYLWFAGLTVFLSMFDAYVDAHLSGSPADDRNDRFSVDIGPDADGGLAAQLSYNF